MSKTSLWWVSISIFKKKAASILNAKDRNLVGGIILFLLQNQFVKSNDRACEIFGKFEHGCGVGVVASGAISDPVFGLMER